MGSSSELAKNIEMLLQNSTKNTDLRRICSKLLAILNYGVQG